MRLSRWDPRNRDADYGTRYGVLHFPRRIAWNLCSLPTPATDAASYLWAWRLSRNVPRLSFSSPSNVAAHASQSQLAIPRTLPALFVGSSAKNCRSTAL
ncbi:hypothetical protein NUW54_g10985 [Trametes sanguinea]|uniref:Uncharacterized protein n=1 Tax=Trametes sanguinea TaxID=158606 RepID=A0ACC1NMU4_9APHY|nr:hypothetical protein NUW54_g10985 [Trametes sanguinea]